MNVGLPGTGIGGMFYLLSALAMPLSEASRRLRDRAASPRGRMVAVQTALAAGILAGMWVTGWLLGLVVHALPPAMHPASTHRPAANVLRLAALGLSFATLAAVLGGVELARLCVQRRRNAELPAEDATPAEPRLVAAGGGTRRWRRGRTLVAVALLGAAVTSCPHHAAAQSPLARADSAFAAGDARSAAREYAAALAADPGNSHAVYRLAQLARDDPARALQLFRRYVALEPTDPWGYMAVGDVLGRLGRYDAALAWYDQALRLAPAERDAVVGRARLLARARRSDVAIAAYEQWLDAHRLDVEAWQALAREYSRAGRPDRAAAALAQAQALVPDATTAWRLAMARAAAAPALTPLVSGSHDSDGNATLRLGGAAELALTGPVRFGAAAGYESVGDGVTTIGLTDAALRAAWRPSAALQVDAAGGATRLDGAVAGGTVFPTGEVRARWRGPATAPALDLRAQRTLLDASPQLVQNRVVRTELGGTLALPLASRLTLRAIGRRAALRDVADLNHRTTLGGVLAIAATPAVELSGQFHEIRYDHGDTVGYFAPRLAQVLEAGSYVEFETARSLLFSFDVGAGVQRVAQQGAPVGPWRRALRLYSLIVLPLAPGRDVRFELDAEDSPIAAAAATSGQWRYTWAALSLRWALPPASP